ncbi:hypothetical protein L3X38_002984 [Prunus dulcis]|uniref:Transposable element protein n=1 Tax=Prunus dulcis TaxID=3755 RepID=A0AAD4ZLF4_PRUDU|nr:hypothetical protein L3X38_002984 [Prunus dulcis]
MKGDLSINDYLDQMNASADNLALAGKPVNDDELVQIIMNSLGPTYDMIVSAVQARDTPITYDTLEALLLTAKRQMVEQVVLMPKNGPSAFVAACGHGGFHPRNFGRGAVSPTREGFPNQRGGSSRDMWQVWHPTVDCFQRMNVAYKGRIPAKRLTAMASSPTTISRQSNGTWLLDTGANAHITPKLQNIINPKEYTGNEQVGGVGPQDSEDAFPREM